MKRIAILVAAALTPALLAQPAFAQRRHKAQKDEPKQEEPKKDAYESPFPTKMNWQLSTINGKNPPAEAYFVIDENLHGAGLSGCNTWSATLYPIKGHRLAMGPVALTKKTCSPDINGFERVYLTILHSGPIWDLQGSTLTVKAQQGVLVFNRGL